MDEHPQLKVIRERLALARHEAELSPEQAARLLGYVSGAAISHLENGTGGITLNMFLNMCDGYRVSASWALTGEQDATGQRARRSRGGDAP